MFFLYQTRNGKLRHKEDSSMLDLKNILHLKNKMKQLFVQSKENIFL